MLQANAMPRGGRFEALDSWRGICACMVALFHFGVVNHIGQFNLIKHAYLFVDFFFVLSGFVIALNYRSRLAEGFGFDRFVLMRLGRIYPLHFFTMLLFIPVELVRYGMGSNLWHAIATNALLLHGLGFNDALWLNFPSWSISAEFAAYLVFAIVVIRFGEGYLPWLIPVVVGPLVLGFVSPNGMNSTYDFGLIRCLYGFALGVICFDLRERLPSLSRPFDGVTDTTIEVSALFIVLIYFGLVSGPHSFAVVSPFLFTGLLLVFARGSGAVSRFLTTRPLLLIGTLSYSIYMTHALVSVVFRAGAKVLEHMFGWQLFVTVGVLSNGEPQRLISIARSPWFGDLLQIVMLLITIALAMLTYRYVEEPGRLWSRKLASRLPKNRGAKQIIEPANP